MTGVSRVKLGGVLPVIELRKSAGLYFVVYPDIQSELVMPFHSAAVAQEIALAVYQDQPFFTMIPVVPQNTAFPRPWLSYPRRPVAPLIPVLIKQ